MPIMDLVMPSLSFRVLVVLAACLALRVVSVSAQTFHVGTYGAPCTAGNFAMGRFLLACGASGTYRYAEPDDMPPAPEGGFTSRPYWYPPLALVFSAPSPPSCPLTGRVTFTSPVIAAEDLAPIIPQGMMVADHVTPIDHGYFGVTPLAKPRATRTEDDFVAVRAPADGDVTEVSLLGSPTSIRVVVAHGCDTYSVYMVLNRLSGALAFLQDDLQARGSLRVNVRILAGEEFGRQRDNPLDFSVHDGGAWLRGFASPFSYTSSESWKPYTVDPWPYFAPDLAELYTANMQRQAEPRWGRIDLDVPGTASGNWFLDGTLGYSGMPLETLRSESQQAGGMVEGKNTYAWSHLALVPHWVQPSKWLLSTGWFADERGDPKQLLIEPDAGQPAPGALTVAHGVVVYRLRQWSFTTPLVNEAPLPVGYDIEGGVTAGFAAVQVLDGDRLSVELFPGVTTRPVFTDFGPNRRLYRR